MVELQLAGDRQHGVAQALGVQAAAIHAPEEAVLGVGREGGRVVDGREPVGARQDDLAHQRLQRPAVVHELDREGVEQFRVRGQFAGRSEVVDGADQACAKEPVPGAVDNDAGGQRIPRRGEPLGQFETAALVGWQRRDLAVGRHLEEASGDPSPQVMNGAADVNPGVADFFLLDD